MAGRDQKTEGIFQYRCRRRDNPEKKEFCAQYCTDPNNLLVPITVWQPNQVFARLTLFLTLTLFRCSSS